MVRSHPGHRFLQLASRANQSMEQLAVLHDFAEDQGLAGADPFLITDGFPADGG